MKIYILILAIVSTNLIYAQFPIKSNFNSLKIYRTLVFNSTFGLSHILDNRIENAGRCTVLSNGTLQYDGNLIAPYLQIRVNI